jgi:hypothetical protein
MVKCVFSIWLLFLSRLQLPLARDLFIGRPAFIKGEGILAKVPVRGSQIQDIPELRVGLNSVGPAELVLVVGCIQKKGGGDTVFSKSHIHKPPGGTGFNQEHLMGFGPELSVEIKGDPGKKGNNLKPYFFQNSGEQPIHFKAVPAAVTGHKLSKQAGQIQRNGPAKKNVQVFKGDGKSVCLVQTLQDIFRRQNPTLKPDSFKICVNVQIVCHYFHPVLPICT